MVEISRTSPAAPREPDPRAECDLDRLQISILRLLCTYIRSRCAVFC